jgi:DNA-binding PadR family transcriptional regulator
MAKPTDKGLVLGEIEELVILAILRLNEYAYGVAIQELLEKATRKTVNVRGLYTTLQRLEGKSLIKTIHPKTRVQNAGRARRYYAVETAGKTALRQTAKQREFWDTHREAVESAPVPALS